jgi:uncharacterized coiled-coil protein SlyX
MDKASESILALKPVTFYYTGDNTSTAQFGLIAEDVVEVNPELTVRDKTGELVTVRYDAVNAMLLNEFLKEHRKMQEREATIEQLNSNAAKQETTIGELKKDIGVLRTLLKEQAAQIQRVEAHIGTSQPATRVAVENPSS